MNDYSRFFDGNTLYGDDFSLDEIKQWYHEEENAYRELLPEDRSYPYHKLNELHGFRFLRTVTHFERVLGFGSADGSEFLPILDRIRSLTIVEPSKTLWVERIGDLLPSYFQPTINGTLDLPSNSFDLITCFGTLHHVPNVRHVLNELIRVLAHKGRALIREPIRTMGDWRLPRPGLTKNERGIPPSYFDRFFERSGVTVISKTFCESLFFTRLPRKLLGSLANTNPFYLFDKAVSWVFQANWHYHPTTRFQKMSPGSIYYVVEKP